MADLSFLAPPHEVADWRLVVTYGAAVESGLMDALPGTAEDLSQRLGLHPHSVRVLLDALGAWDVVRQESDVRYVSGPDAPAGDDAMTLLHHARAVQGWTRLGEALHETVAPAQRGPVSPDRFQTALAVGARRRAVALVDAILRHTGDVRSMLDLGGGHGVRGVVQPGGTVAIITMLQRRHARATIFAVQMLVNGSGGDTHEESQYRAWLADAGYAGVEVFDIPETETQSAILGRVVGA